MEILRVALFVLGYPVAIAVIVRFIPVVRERRTRWIVAHEIAVAAIVAGHALNDNTSAVVINGAWLLIAVLWYALGQRRQPA